MAALTNGERAGVAAEFMRQMQDPCGVIKTVIRTSVDNVDAEWEATTGAALNTSLPVAARTGLTIKEKARLLILILKQKFGV